MAPCAQLSRAEDKAGCLDNAELRQDLIHDPTYVRPAVDDGAIECEPDGLMDANVDLLSTAFAVINLDNAQANTSTAELPREKLRKAKEQLNPHLSNPVMIATKARRRERRKRARKQKKYDELALSSSRKAAGPRQTRHRVLSKAVIVPEALSRYVGPRQDQFAVKDHDFQALNMSVEEDKDGEGYDPEQWQPITEVDPGVDERLERAMASMKIMKAAHRRKAQQNTGRSKLQHAV